MSARRSRKSTTSPDAAVSRRRALTQAAAAAVAGIASSWIGAPVQAQGGDYPSPFPRAGATKVLENDRVVIWDVLWPKGQPTPKHEHRLDHVSITITGGEMKQIRADGTVNNVTVKTGAVGFVKKGTVHVEEGSSDVPRRAIIVELK